MNRLRRWSLCVAAAAVMAAVTVQSAPLRAQVARAPVIGVIDIQGVLRASTAVQALSREVEARRDRTQAAMQGREEALRSADSDLAQQIGRASRRERGWQDGLIAGVAAS